LLQWLRADKFGTWPKPYAYKPGPIEGSPEVMACVRSRIICFGQVLRDMLKSSARSTQQIRCRPTAPQAPRNRIRANADNRKASRPSLFELNFTGDAARTGNRLVDQHLPHFRFRRISPQWFLVSRFVAKTRPAFRGLWRKPGMADRRIGVRIGAEIQLITEVRG
jgi:hypothetical protein